VVQSLWEKGDTFSESEKQALLEQQIEVMQVLVSLMRRLERRQQIELSATPMYHPILPLLIDTETRSRSDKSRTRPPRMQAAEDAAAHIDETRALSREFLGIDIDGMWPPEGAVSTEALELFGAADLGWTVADETTLRMARDDGFERNVDLYRPWMVEGSLTPEIFFGDRRIRGLCMGGLESDTDASVDEPEAVATQVIAALEEVDGRTDDDGADDRVVTVALDGDAFGEQYEQGGVNVLSALFDGLSDSEVLTPTTPSETLDEQEAQTAQLSSVPASTHDEGSFRRWIGGEYTNRAWELLGRARSALMEREQELSPPERRHAWEALYSAEGSDWFRWYGDDSFTGDDSDFDRLFRNKLRFVHGLIDKQVPPYLDRPIRAGEQESSFDPPHKLIHPRIDGSDDSYWEWSGSGVYRHAGTSGASFEVSRLVDEIRLGFDLERLYVQVVPAAHPPGLTGLECRMRIHCEGWMYRVSIDIGSGLHGEIVSDGEEREPLELLAYDRTLEFAVPFDVLNAGPDDELELRLGLWDDRIEQEHHPPTGHFELEVPGPDWEDNQWGGSS
jgi:alpha-amylase/alpha-mannosidase (GH57 family)